jgi:FKBP-type peptidyl-prolyl cis-trans isomerase
MRTRTLLIALTVCLLFGGTAQGQRRARLRTAADSVAYYFGIDFARQMQQMYKELPIDFQTEAAAAAIEEVFNPRNASSLPETEEGHAFLNEYFTVRMPAENLRASQAWLAEVERSEPGIRRTASGLLYRIVDPGNPSVRASRDGDRLEMYFTGSLRNGTVVFDYSRERGETETYALEQVIAGCIEGLKLIGKGGTIDLWLPPRLAYGEQGAPGMNVPPNAALRYEVEIVDVIPAKDLRRN